MIMLTMAPMAAMIVWILLLVVPRCLIHGIPLMIAEAPNRIAHPSIAKGKNGVFPVSNASIAQLIAMVNRVGGVMISFSGRIVIGQLLLNSTLPEGPIAKASNFVVPSEIGTTDLVLGFHCAIFPSATEHRISLHALPFGSSTAETR